MRVRSRFIAGVLGIAISALMLMPRPGVAQQWPQKPVKIVSQYMAGATADKVVQIVAEILRESLGQPVIVEDAPGQEGVLAAEIVAKAAPDGYTLLFAGASTQVMRVHLVKTSSFDPVKSFTPIAIVGESPALILASTKAPVRDFRELIAYAKANPGKLKYGTPRTGSPNHLTNEQIAMMTGGTMVHVPEGGQARREQVLASGEVDTAYMVLPVAEKMIREGKARPLAVVAEKRIPEMPDVPAIGEVIPGFQPLRAWVALFGPAGMPAEATQRLNSAIHAGMATQKHAAAMTAAGYARIPGSPAEFAAVIARDVNIVGEVVKAAGITPQ